MAPSAVTQPLVAGNATFTLSGLTVDAHSLLAQYPGDRLRGQRVGREPHRDLGHARLHRGLAGDRSRPDPECPRRHAGPRRERSFRERRDHPRGSREDRRLDPATGAFSTSFDTGGLTAGAHPIAFAYAGDANFEPASADAALVVTTAVTTTTFSNPRSIVISDAAPGSPYPSVITVSGLPGKVLEAEVTLKGVSHSFPADTSFLLVGPDGNSTLLLHHTGGDLDVVDADLAFDDAGPAAPVSGTLVSGTYRPTRTGEAADLPPGGAPGPDPPLAPYGEWLFAQNGGSPNGAWRLYVADDVLGDAGDVAEGWDLRLTTAVAARAVGR